MEVVGGRYEVEREIGRGGMGVVLLARDSRIDRPVALKKLAPHSGFLDSDDAIQRFAREARLTGKLSHQRIVTLYDVVEEEGSLYLVLEYYPSQSLGERVRESGPLDEATTREIGAQIASALAAAHAAGVVHRDIKPDNVLLGEDGAKLTDFGVARSMAESGEPSIALTQTGLLIGTPQFMAPEQIKGERAGPPSDVFAAGLVLYFALTGSMPFAATDPAAIVYQIVHQPLDVSGVPASGELRQIIEAATAKSPGDRPDAIALKSLLAGETSMEAAAPGGGIDEPVVPPLPPSAAPPSAAPPAASTDEFALAAGYPPRKRRGCVVASIVLAIVAFIAIIGTIGGLVALQALRNRAEVLLESAPSPGSDPFTVPLSEAAPMTATAAPQPPGGGSVAAGAPNTFGRVGENLDCDREKLVGFLTSPTNQDRAGEWARVVGISQSQIPEYARALIPTTLGFDTRVTNHRWQFARAVPYQAVLQAGTAVLVDPYGKVVVRCRSGNPLTPPVSFRGTPRYVGTPWPGWDPSRVVTVTPANQPILPSAGGQLPAATPPAPRKS